MAEEISIKEAQAILGVSKMTVYAHIHKGNLHPIKYLAGRGPGGLRTFLDRAEVEALKVAPAPAAAGPETAAPAPRSLRPKAKPKGRTKRK